MLTLLQYLGPFPDCLLFRCLDPIPDGLTLGYLGLSLDCVNYGNLDPFPDCLTQGDLETFHVCLVFSIIFPYRPLFVRHHPWLTSANLLLLWKTVFCWWHFSPLTPGSLSGDRQKSLFLVFLCCVSCRMPLTCAISSHHPLSPAHFDVLVTILCWSRHNHTCVHLSLHLKSLWSALGHVNYWDPDDPDFFTEPLSFHKVLWLHAGVTSNYFWIRRIFGLVTTFSNNTSSRVAHPSEDRSRSQTFLSLPSSSPRYRQVLHIFEQVFHFVTSCVCHWFKSFLDRYLYSSWSTLLLFHFIGTTSLCWSNFATCLYRRTSLLFRSSIS